MGDPARTHQPARPTPAHDEAAKATTTVPAPVPIMSRLSYLPPVFDVGEQIEGTSHVFELAAPFNGGASEAQISATIANNAAFSIESMPRTLAPINPSTSGEVLQEQLAKKLRVRFSPAEVGRDFHAELTFIATWSDGATETRKVALLGAARRLTSAPSPTREEQVAMKQRYDEQVAAERAEAAAKDAYQHDRHERPPLTGPRSTMTTPRSGPRRPWTASR